jgi:hypothetical protein
LRKWLEVLPKRGKDVELVRGAEGGVDKIVSKACCKKPCSKVTAVASKAANLASKAANLTKDAVNLAREAVNLARDASIPAKEVAIPAREVANLAREEPTHPSIHAVAKNIMAKKCEMTLVQKKPYIIICECVLCECVTLVALSLSLFSRVCYGVWCGNWARHVLAPLEPNVFLPLSGTSAMPAAAARVDLMCFFAPFLPSLLCLAFQVSMPLR